MDGKESDGCYALYFNCSEGKPTADARVRQAIAYAIDTPAVASTAYGDGGVAATTISKRTDIEWEDSMADLEPLYPYNPEKARELLAEAGYADGLDNLPILFLFISSACHLHNWQSFSKYPSRYALTFPIIYKPPLLKKYGIQSSYGILIS